MSAYMNKSKKSKLCNYIYIYVQLYVYMYRDTIGNLFDNRG